MSLIIISKIKNQGGDVLNLHRQYSSFIFKQKHYLNEYKRLKAPLFLVKIQEDLSNISFFCWIFYVIKKDIKKYYRSALYKIL